MKRFSTPLKTLGRSLILWWMVTLGGGAVSASDDLDDEIRQLESFANALHLIQRHYLEPVGYRRLIRAAMAGMAADLDPYSEILDGEDLEALEDQAVGRYTGVGVLVQKIEDGFVIVRVVRSSPAARAGLRSGDVIVRIDGQPVVGISHERLQRQVSGNAGTEVTIGFYRPADPDLILERRLIRTYITTESIEHFAVTPKTLVIQIRQFQKSTPQELDALLSAQSYRAVILDLRDNPGGLFLSAVESAERLVPVGLLVETRDRAGRIMDRYVSRRPPLDEPYRLLVLINRYTASGAEIVAGAIQDRGVGRVIGERSFGKGVVQTVFPLENRYFLKLTTAAYFTPSGKRFHRVGIEPDLGVTDHPQKPRYGVDDRVFARAMDLVREHIGRD